MKTKQILIKGRKVRCRALVYPELREEGDVYANGQKVPRYALTFVGDSCIFRPLKSKPRTAKAGKPVIKTIKAWIDEDFLDPNLCPGEGFWRMYSTAHDHWEGRKFIEVTISYRKKK